MKKQRTRKPPTRHHCMVNEEMENNNVLFDVNGCTVFLAFVCVCAHNELRLISQQISRAVASHLVSTVSFTPARSSRIVIKVDAGSD